MKKYKHVFFDLDHTLWDFETNAAETLNEIYSRFNLFEKRVPSSESFIRMYKSINERMWDDYEKRKISKEYLRTKRFYKTLLTFNVDDSALAEKIGIFYVQDCPKKKNLFPGAIEMLTYLQPKYQLHIITNGFEEVQKIKIKTSGIGKFFNKIVISEIAGSNKPEKKIFNYALKSSGALRSESLMIGDNLGTDIIGAKNSGIDQCFFNPEKKNHLAEVTYEISSLLELKRIL